MKFYLLFIILFSNTVLADVQPYVNPFISDFQPNHFTVSSTTGIVVKNVRTHPTLQATSKMWRIKTKQIDSSTDLLLRLQAGETVNSRQLIGTVALEVDAFDDAIMNLIRRSVKSVGNNSLKKIGSKLRSKVITKGVKST